MKRFKLCAFIMSAAFIGNMSASCGDLGDKTIVTDTRTLSGTSNEPTPIETIFAPDIKAIDCGGRDYVILSREITPSYNGNPYAEFTASEMNADVLNDSVYKRNMYIEEKYNLNLVSIETNNVAGDAQKAVLAADDSYDLLSISARPAFNMAINNQLMNINKLPYVNFDKPWWMSYVLENTSIGGNNFFMAGMMNIGMLNTVGITYFNKSLADKFDITYPYQDVKNGKWTIDNMLFLCKGVTSDLNGDSVFDEKDRYGLECSSFAWQPLYYGSDNLMIKKDANDLPYFDSGSERMYDTILKIIELLNNKETTLNVNHLSGVGDLGMLTVNLFMNDQALFFVELIYGVPPLRNMESYFGILPMPKYDSAQERYSTYIHTSNASVMAVPVTNTNSELTGSLLEDIAYQSYELVLPAFYDIMLKTKFARDDESAEMLDIIYENISVDLSLLMIDNGINIDGVLRNACTSGDTGITSKLAANEEIYKQALEKATDAFIK